MLRDGLICWVMWKRLLSATSNPEPDSAFNAKLALPHVRAVSRYSLLALTAASAPCFAVTPTLMCFFTSISAFFFFYRLLAQVANRSIAWQQVNAFRRVDVLRLLLLKFKVSIRSGSKWRDFECVDGGGALPDGGRSECLPKLLQICCFVLFLSWRVVFSNGLRWNDIMRNRCWGS